jgi:hypothetical protein
MNMLVLPSTFWLEHAFSMSDQPAEFLCGREDLSESGVDH